MIDSWKSKTYPIELLCGSMRVTVIEEEDRPKKIFPSELKMHQTCSQRLLAVIMELVAELCKTSAGYKAASKILYGPTCLVVFSDDKNVMMCTGEIAKILDVHKETKPDKEDK